MILKGVICFEMSDLGTQYKHQVKWSWKESIVSTITKLGQMVLKGVNWVHNDKISSYGLERSNLCTQCKKSENWFCAFSWKCVHFPSNFQKMRTFLGENARIFERPLSIRIIFWFCHFTSLSFTLVLHRYNAMQNTKHSSTTPIKMNPLQRPNDNFVYYYFEYSTGSYWSFVIYESPILGDNPKPHNFAWWKVLLFSKRRCAFQWKAWKAQCFSYERPFARNCNPMFYLHCR